MRTHRDPCAADEREKDQRGRAGTPKNPSLPDRWLDSRELQETHRAELTEAELHHSGG